MNKRMISLMMAGAMVLTSSCAGAETMKRERVYAVLDSQGQVQTVIDNVHLENADKLDEMADRTQLSGVENMAGHETFKLDGETLTWQADGKDIIYQGQGNKALPVTPKATLTLDGKEVTAAQLADMSGDMELTVRFDEAQAPYLTLTVLPLPEGLTGVETENAMLLTEGERQVLVGYAVPGVSDELELPASFTVKGKADHVSLQWMMTVATAQPIDAACEALADKAQDAAKLKDDAVALLTALSNGTDLPELDGDWTSVTDALTTVKTGVNSLNDGAVALKDGAGQINDGAASLETGLTTLVGNNDTLNGAASQLFDAVLNTANQQLANAGLETAGITLPVLTQENYAEALQGAMDALNPETLRAAATEQARGKVEQAVKSQENKVRATVEPAVEAKVLEAVLEGAGLKLTAEQYQAAVSAGQVTNEQATQISAAVKQQMATDAVKAQLEAAVQQQLEQLVEQNLQSEDVQKQINDAIAPAQAGYEALASLKAQLDGVQQFVTGLAAYTAGVSQAQTCAAQLHAGATSLSDGAAQLVDGTTQLANGLESGMKDLADKALPYCTDDLAKVLRLYNETSENAANAGHYDLVAEGMNASTVYVMRTDLQ